MYIDNYNMETCKSQISVLIESRIESAAAIRIRIESRIESAYSLVYSFSVKFLLIAI